jgi:hypothetical protein
VPGRRPSVRDGFPTPCTLFVRSALHLAVACTRHFFLLSTAPSAHDFLLFCFHVVAKASLTSRCAVLLAHRLGDVAVGRSLGRFRYVPRAAERRAKGRGVSCASGSHRWFLTDSFSHVGEALLTSEAWSRHGLGGDGDRNHAYSSARPSLSLTPYPKPTLLAFKRVLIDIKNSTKGTIKWKISLTAEQASAPLQQ